MQPFIESPSAAELPRALNPQGAATATVVIPGYTADTNYSGSCHVTKRYGFRKVAR